MRLEDELEVFCPLDGAVITIGSVTAPGWFVVVHENDDDGVHDFGVWVEAEIEA